MLIVCSRLSMLAQKEESRVRRPDYLSHYRIGSPAFIATRLLASGVCMHVWWELIVATKSPMDLQYCSAPAILSTQA